MPARRTFGCSPLSFGRNQRECPRISQSPLGPLIRARPLCKSFRKEERTEVGKPAAEAIKCRSRERPFCGDRKLVVQWHSRRRSSTLNVVHTSCIILTCHSTFSFGTVFRPFHPLQNIPKRTITVLLFSQFILIFQPIERLSADYSQKEL